MSCVRCENPLFGFPIPRFDAFLEANFLKRVFDNTGNLSLVAETAAREVITYQQEWGTNKPAQPVIFFRYEKDPNGWSWAGEHFLSYFDPSQPGGDQKDRYAKAEKNIPKNGQALVFSEDPGQGFNKAYIYVYTDYGDHIDAVAYEHRGSTDSLARTQKLLAKREGEVANNIDFSEPLFFKERIRPTEFLHAIVQGYDEVDKTSNQDYLQRITKAIDQLPLLKSQFENQVKDFAQQAKEQFVQSEVGTKLFSDVVQTMVQSLEQSEDLISVESAAEGKVEAHTSSTERQLATREPASEIVETVAAAAKSAMKDTVATTMAVGTWAIEHMPRKKHEKQKVDKTESSRPLPEARNYSYQFAQRIVLRELDKKIVKEHKHATPIKVIHGLEKIASYVTSPLKKKETKKMNQPEQIVLKKREVKKKTKLRLLVEKMTKKKTERNQLLQIRRKVPRLERRSRQKELQRPRLLAKESKSKMKKKELLILKKEKLQNVLVTLIKRILKLEIIASPSIEKKKARIKEKKLVMRLAFAWVLWLSASNHFHLSIDESEKSKSERLPKKEPTPWILLAIIWYLAMIRESRGAGSGSARQIHPKKQAAYPPPTYKIPKQAVIFAFAS